MTFTLEIITPQRQAFGEEVHAVYVPTASGIIGILPHHVALFTEIIEGEIKIVTGKKEYYIAIGGGFMEVAGNKALILVSRAVHADELNEEAIKRAEGVARDAINRRAKGDERALAQSVLRRSFVEMKVLRRHKARPLPS